MNMESSDNPYTRKEYPPCDKPPSVPLQPVVGRMRIAVRLILWAWYWLPLLIAYCLLWAISWAGDLASEGMIKINKMKARWEPYGSTANALGSPSK